MQLYYANDVGTSDPVFSTKDVLVTGDPGAHRLPGVATLDLRAEKSFSFARYNLLFDVDVFNVTNASTVLGGSTTCRPRVPPDSIRCSRS